MGYEYMLSSRVTYLNGKRAYMCVCGIGTGPTACFMSYTCAVKCVKCILISIETLCVLLEFQMDFFRVGNGFAYTAASSHLMWLARNPILVHLWNIEWARKLSVIIIVIYSQLKRGVSMWTYRSLSAQQTTPVTGMGDLIIIAIITVLGTEIDCQGNRQ